MSPESKHHLAERRILYKISGESLTLQNESGYNFKFMHSLAEDIKKVHLMGLSICLVVGGGNLCRGTSISKAGIERTVGDHMGMLATIMNAIAIQSILENHCNLEARVLSAIPVKPICELYVRRRALHHVEKGRIVIFAAGLGNAFFTTDACAVLRAVEMNCEAVFKGTGVDGAYSADPKTNPQATRYDVISYDTVLNNKLNFMDHAAIALARDNNMPINIFSITEGKDPLYSLLSGHRKYTTISAKTI